MPPGSQFRLRLRRRIEKLWGTIFSFKKHTKDGRCFWAEYFFDVFWRLPLKSKSRKNNSSKVAKILNYRPVEGSPTSNQKSYDWHKNEHGIQPKVCQWSMALWFLAAMSSSSSDNVTQSVRSFVRSFVRLCFRVLFLVYVLTSPIYHAF